MALGYALRALQLDINLGVSLGADLLSLYEDSSFLRVGKDDSRSYSDS